MIKLYEIKAIIILSICAIITFSAFKQTKKLTRDEAIKSAEEFIIVNGYTSLPADSTKMSFELFDGYSHNRNEIIKRRLNTLHTKAFCYAEDDETWDIGFLSTNVDLKNLDAVTKKTNLPGRAVIVNKNGKEIRIAHKDPLFSYFKKL